MWAAIPGGFIMIGLIVANDNQSEAKGFVVLRGSLILGEIVKESDHWSAYNHQKEILTKRLDKEQAYADVVSAYKGKTQVRG